MNWPHKGTIFLDEIGEIPTVAPGQASARASGKGNPPHRQQPATAGGRAGDFGHSILVSRKKSGKGQFRADLYYRLNLLDITIPPLREQVHGDIREMVDFYLTRFACEMGKPIPRLSQGRPSGLDDPLRLARQCAGAAQHLRASGCAQRYPRKSGSGRYRCLRSSAPARTRLLPGRKHPGGQPPGPGGYLTLPSLKPRKERSRILPGNWGSAGPPCGAWERMAKEKNEKNQPL